MDCFTTDLVQALVTNQDIEEVFSQSFKVCHEPPARNGAYGVSGL